MVRIATFVAVCSVISMPFSMAFTMKPSSSSSSSSSSTLSSSLTSLNLVPGQGQQLVAAWSASTSSKNNNDNADNDNKTMATAEVNATKSETSTTAAATASATTPETNKKISPTGAARAFVSKVFSLPTALHPSSFANNLNNNNEEDGSNDVVLYPLVGFRIVHDPEANRMHCLPTISNASCQLPRGKDEVVYGWYSPVCRLDMYQEDICVDPNNNVKTP